MREDPLDQSDARFIVSRAGFSRDDVLAALARARVPAIPEIQTEFKMCADRLLKPQ
jgi:hypothetical protein